MSRKKKIIIASLIAVFLIAGIVLIQNKKQSKKIDNKYFSYEVGTNTFESYIEADGSVKSDNTKKISTPKNPPESKENPLYFSSAW